MSLDEHVRERARTAAAETGLVTFDGSVSSVLTWTELERVTGRLAEQLTSFVDPHERAALVVETDNTTDSTLLLLASLRTPLPVLVSAAKAARTENAAICEQVLRAGNAVVVTQMDERGCLSCRRLMPRRVAAPVPLTAHSLLFGSGGSSGRPKIVVDPFSRARLERPAAVRITARVGWRRGQTQLVTAPLHHAASLTFFIEGLADGNTLVVQRGSSPDTTFALIEQHAVEWLQVTPFHMRRMAAVAKRRSPDLRTVRAMLHTGAPCPESTKRFWIDRLGPPSIFEMYGASEGIGVTLARGDEWLDHRGTVGRGFLTQLRILDDAELPVPPGTVGEVYMRSPGRAAWQCYLGANTNLKTTMDGFMSVGDHGRLDEDGYLFLDARRLDMIVVGGENVYPSEVEAVLLEHPSVVDAAASAEDDKRLGARVIAIVVVVDGANVTEAELVSFCRSRLSRFKVPRWIAFAEELPRNDVGKLRRSDLKPLIGTLTGRSDLTCPTEGG